MKKKKQTYPNKDNIKLIKERVNDVIDLICDELELEGKTLFKGEVKIALYQIINTQ